MSDEARSEPPQDIFLFGTGRPAASPLGPPTTPSRSPAVGTGWAVPPTMARQARTVTRFECAGLVTRVLAKLIDVFFAVLIVWLTGFVPLLLLRAVPDGPLLAELVPSLLVLGYLVHRLGASGQTWGMRMFSIKCVRAAQVRDPIGTGLAVLRWIVAGCIYLVPIGIVVDSLWMLWDPKRQTIHDKVCRTVVVRIR